MCSRDQPFTTLEEVALNVITGKTPSTAKPEYYGDHIPFVTIPDMHDQIWLSRSERFLSEAGELCQPGKTVDRGAVLVSCIATVGLVGIASKPIQFNQQINAIMLSEKGDEYWLYQSLLHAKDELLAIGAGGSATLNVSKGALLGIAIPWGSKETRRQYAKQVGPIFSQIEKSQYEINHLRDLRDLLLSSLGS